MEFLNRTDYNIVVYFRQGFTPHVTLGVHTIIASIEELNKVGTFGLYVVKNRQCTQPEKSPS